MTTVEYRCADGTPFPVTFVDEAQAEKVFRLDREHGAFPATPLMAAALELGVAGSRAASDELGVPPAKTTGRAPKANGFSYVPDVADPSENFDVAAMFEAIGKLVTDHGGALGVWRQATMPQAQAAADALDAAPADIPFAQAVHQYSYGMQMTMISAFVCFNDHQLLAAACADVFPPDDAQLIAYELTQGYDNPTIRADQALWDLGQLALEAPAVLEALRSSDAAASMRALRDANVEPGFFGVVDAFLAEYGRRCEAWDIVCPTWQEQEEGFWRQLAKFAAHDAPSPSEALAKAAQRRESLAAAISARLAPDAAKQARFQRRYQRAADYVLVREERALLQLILAGALRGVALRHGARLVAEGRLDAASDVFYLVPEELEGDDDLRERASDRRVRHDRWCAVTPPPVIGGTAPAQASPLSLPDDRVLRGLAGSRGLVTGTARVVTDLADADRIAPGDVLVCVLTAPPWTPLFAVASAVVTDSGGLASHPAIAAREYGIPCVLDTRIGTSVIPDGALVTVDGEAGTVEVVPG